jgi:hypothetical protein
MGSLRTCSYGLGFKNHVVKKVRVGSVADLAGLQLNDTLEMVNEVSVAGRPDEHVHAMIRQAVGDAPFCNILPILIIEFDCFYSKILAATYGA